MFNNELVDHYAFDEVPLNRDLYIDVGSLDREVLCFRDWLVGRAGFEPATNGLKVRCSTN